MSSKRLFIILFFLLFTFLTGLGILAFRLFHNEEKLNDRIEAQHRSLLLADELRHSSDDLTRMARTYVVTGNPRYEDVYWAMLDIRRGKSPRPVDYDLSYWDLYLADGQKPRPDGETISFYNLMEREGFAPAELDKLTEALSNSEEMVKDERIAMNAVKGLFDDGKGNFTVKKNPDRELAIQLLNDDAFHKAKASIMNPINEFVVMIENRTSGDIQIIEKHSINLILAIITLILIILGILAVSFVIILRQITRRQKAEVLLQESEEKYRLIFEHSPLGILSFDSEGVILACNDNFVQIIGSTHEALIGKNILNNSDKKLVASVREALKGGASLYEDTYHSISTQKIIPISAFFAPMYIKGLPGGVGIVEDITERKRAEEEIKEANKQLSMSIAEKDKFFSIIAHDLKSPFNSILGFSNLLVEEIQEKDYDNIQKYAGIIQQSSNKAIDLLMNLMEWAQSQTGRMEFSPEYIELVNLIEDTELLLSGALQQKSITISKIVPADMPVFADKKMIDTVFRNLISNAIKFTYPGGKITISVSEKQNELLVSVSDNGVGMPKEHLEKLFRIDESYSTSGTKNESGTGLGLILCKEFVEKQGGRIWVESEENIGSVFYFTLPQSEAKIV